MLAEVLQTADAPAVFEWLRGLSFIEHGSEGLFPHDLAREVLDADLRWRDPKAYRDLNARLVRSLVPQLQTRTGREQQRSYFDLMYLSRHNQLMRSHFDWDSLGTTYFDPATPDDFPEILAMVSRHEGEASSRIAAYWLERQPDAFLAFRSAERQLDGFATVLITEEMDEEDCATDPAIAAAWQFVAHHGPLRRGERLMHNRFWMSCDGYQSPAALNVVAAVSGTRWLTTARLAWNFILTAQPETHGRNYETIRFQRARSADFEVGERHYAVYAHDWRVEPAHAWIERRGLLDAVDAVADVHGPSVHGSSGVGGAVSAGFRGSRTASPA